MILAVRAWKIAVWVCALTSMMTGKDAVAQDSSRAWRDCQTEDADRRISGCTIAINQKGFGSQSKLADALDGRCWAYHLKGMFVQAVADCKAAIVIRPTYSFAYNNLGAAYIGLGEYNAAIQALTKAIELKSNFVWSWANRAKANEAVGNIAAAISDYQRAASLDATNQGFQQAIDSLKSRLLDATISQAPQRPTMGGAQPAPAAWGALPAGVQSPERRVALIVGNSRYAAVPKLANPLRDAAAVAAGLRRVGFQSVDVVEDATREELSASLRRFARQAEASDWAVIYYSGHGLEMNGSNYVIPIDARLETDRDVALEAVALDGLLTAIDGAKKLKLIILDACRDNPFKSLMRRTGAITRSLGRGLAPIEPEGGTLVVYAAKHGEFALDGEGLNSPFVTAFVDRLPVPGVEVRRLFDLVRDDVLAATRKRQQPFSYGSLPGSQDFFFVAKK